MTVRLYNNANAEVSAVSTKAILSHAITTMKCFVDCFSFVDYGIITDNDTGEILYDSREG